MIQFPSKQPKNTSNKIVVEFHNTSDTSSMMTTRELFILNPTDSNLNSKSDWKWEGKWEKEDIYVVATKGFLDITFSDNFPFLFKSETENEINRILKQYN